MPRSFLRLPLSAILCLSLLHHSAHASDTVWTQTLACVSLFVTTEKVPDLGIPTIQLLGLSRYATNTQSHLIFLKPVAGALRFQKHPNAAAKPMKVWLGQAPGKRWLEPLKFKSARRGPFEGVVTKPSAQSFNPRSFEYAVARRIWNENWPKFEKNGFYLDSNDIVRDANGTMFYSDYDVVAVIDSKSRRKNFGKDGDHKESVRTLLQPLNTAVGGQFFRHDGYYESEYFDELVKTPAEVIILSPDGRGQVLSTGELPAFMKTLTPN